MDIRQAKRCFALGTRLRGCDRRVGRILESDIWPLRPKNINFLFFKQASDSRIRPTPESTHTFLAEVAGRLKFFQAACNLCKTPFPSLLRRQEPGLKRSLKRSFNCRTGRRHPNKNNQIFDFIGSLLFSEICKPSKALLCTGHPPARVRQIFGFAKVSACNLFLFSLKQTTLIFIQNAV